MEFAAEMVFDGVGVGFFLSKNYLFEKPRFIMEGLRLALKQCDNCKDAV